MLKIDFSVISKVAPSYDELFTRSSAANVLLHCTQIKLLAEIA